MKANRGQTYLDPYPDLEKRRVNQRAACRRTGDKPEMPENIYPGAGARHLRGHFGPLGLDETGLCEQRREALRPAG